MAGPYPLATLACTIDAAGISAPSYTDILESLKASFRAIYGDDIYLEADAQDGQVVAIVAAAINDANMNTIAVYNSFGPHTAVGEALSSRVKINNIARLVSTKSQVNVTLVGVVGTTITAGIVGDAGSSRWLLPATVVIPITGTIDVTATAEFDGATLAAPGEVNRILTPTPGWQSVTNALAATPGNPVETDAQLRARQQAAPALLSKTPVDALTAALAAVSGVDYVRVYENDDDAPDGDGIPGHSIAAVVQGGDAAEIAAALFAKKNLGTGTHGTTSVTVLDASGTSHVVRFFVPVERRILVECVFAAGSGYTSEIGDRVRQAVVDYGNGLNVGDDALIPRFYLPAQLFGGPGSETYELTSVKLSIHPAAPATADVPIPFNERAHFDIGDVVLTVV